jgi:hypothetical protein
VVGERKNILSEEGDNCLEKAPWEHPGIER